MFTESGINIGKRPLSDENSAIRPKFNWKLLSVEELLAVRHEITEALPTSLLSQLDTEKELMLQLSALTSLQGQVLNDDEIPLNQRVTLANSVASLLKSIIDLQGDVYTQERFKSIENSLIKMLTKLPEDAAAAFLVEYEEIIRK